MDYNVKSCDLDDFVRHVDETGGLSSNTFQDIRQNFKLVYETQVDITQDPYSETYVEQQVALYGELTGKSRYDSENECMSFDLNAHVSATNPYALRSPSLLVHHYLRIGELVQRAMLPQKPYVLDLGAGWGLSSEFLAVLGADVYAMDINPLFVELVNKRAARFQYPVKAAVASFEQIPTKDLFDFIMFYECLHHAVRPWRVIQDCATLLKRGGKIGLSGEPIQDFWWPNWGLRLDPESVYCMRKFGWFESGWSQTFLADMFARSGLNFELYKSSTPMVGLVGLGAVPISATPIATDDLFSLLDGWIVEGQYAISTGRATIDVTAMPKGSAQSLYLSNFRSKPLWCKLFHQNGEVLLERELIPGENHLEFKLAENETSLTIESETWIPGQELHNGDTRAISFHMNISRCNRG